MIKNSHRFEMPNPQVPKFLALPRTAEEQRRGFGGIWPMAHGKLLTGEDDDTMIHGDQ